ncbi:MAG: hypothetical protein NTV86_17870, partial [Planctomycetota bacterium]|nr:hypothetical protein [Planctomycetota bacterium]
MKSTSKTTACLVALMGVMCLALPASGGPTTKPATKPAKAKEEPVKAPDVPFIISYWCGPPKEATTFARMKEIADCGFNVAQGPNLWEKPDAAQVVINKRFLNLCQQAGIKAFIWDGNVCKGTTWDKFSPEDIPGIEKDLDGMIANYSSHPALLGFVLGDEMLTPAHPRLGMVTQYLLKKDPKHVPYYNLLPLYAFKNATEYENLVANYMETVKPALLSWDHYRQMFENGDERTYWENLEIMRRQCLKTGTPFNQIIVSLRHMGYRECSEADLRWQVWTSLAYGSRGINYFTYWFVPGLAWADAPAFISKEGKRDVKWTYGSKINHRIGKLGPTLVKLTSTDVFCTDPLPIGTHGLGEEGPVKKAEGGAMVIGCFKDAAAKDGSAYILPVNRVFNAAIKATLTLDEKFVSASEISQETG